MPGPRTASPGWESRRASAVSSQAAERSRQDAMYGLKLLLLILKTVASPRIFLGVGLDLLCKKGPDAGFFSRGILRGWAVHVFRWYKAAIRYLNGQGPASELHAPSGRPLPRWCQKISAARGGRG